MTENIRYRGAKQNLNEYNAEHQAQLEQQQGSKHVQYRGAEDDVERKAHETQETEVQYRGATDKVDL